MSRHERLSLLLVQLLRRKDGYAPSDAEIAGGTFTADGAARLLRLLERFGDVRMIDVRLQEMLFETDALALYDATHTSADSDLGLAIADVRNRWRPRRVVPASLEAMPTLPIREPRLHVRSGEVAFTCEVDGRSYRTTPLQAHGVAALLFLLYSDAELVSKFEELLEAWPREALGFLAGTLDVVGGEPRLVPAGIEARQLEPLLSHPDRAVREDAITALARIQQGAAGPAPVR